MEIIGGRILVSERVGGTLSVQKRVMEEGPKVFNLSNQKEKFLSPHRGEVTGRSDFRKEFEKFSLGLVKFEHLIRDIE